MRLRSLLLPVGVLTALTLTARADDDYEDEPFSLRFPSALSRFSRYPDVAGTAGASAGAIWGSAPNPAASAWLAMDGVSAQYSRVDFDAGTGIDVASFSWSIDLEEFGALQPSLTRASSNRATTREGVDFVLDAVFAELQWATRPTEEEAWGLNVFGSTSDTEFSLGHAPLVRGSSGALGVRGGYLRQLSEPFRLGAALEHSVSWDRAKAFDPTGAGRHMRSHDRTEQTVFQPGISWKYGQARRVYADYKLGRLRNDEGSLTVHRFLVGIDHEFVPALNGRLGAALDDRGNCSPTIGLGIFPSENVFIDVSYQRDMFPEVRREFGRSHTIGVALSISF